MEKSTAQMATMNWHAMMNCWQKLLVPQLLTWDQSVSTNFFCVLIAFVPFFPSFLLLVRSFLHSLPLHCSGLPPPPNPNAFPSFDKYIHGVLQKKEVLFMAS